MIEKIPTLTEDQAYLEFLGMQQLFGYGTTYDERSENLTRTRRFLETSSDEALIDLHEDVEDAYSLFTPEVERMAVDMDELSDVFDGLVTAHVAGESNLVEGYFEQLGILPEDRETARTNLDETSIPYLQITDPNLPPNCTPELEEIIKEETSRLNKSMAMESLIRKPQTEESRAEEMKNYAGADFMDGAIWALPYIDPTRAIRVYSKGLESEASAAGTVAIGLLGLALATGQDSLDIWRRALSHEDEEVHSIAFSSLQEVLGVDGNPASELSDEAFLRRLRILYNAYKNDFRI